MFLIYILTYTFYLVSFCANLIVSHGSDNNKNDNNIGKVIAPIQITGQ